MVEPDAPFFIFLADEKTEIDDAASPYMVASSDLNLTLHDEMAFRYTLLEFSTAIKPSCFKYLFEEKGYEKAIYLDPDIQVFSPLSDVEDALEHGASAVLTPHLLKPLEDNKSPGDIEILRSGTFNLGFAALRNTDETNLLLEWWQRQLESHCYIDLENGLFVDQKFMEYAPSFLEHLNILRHPGYNVAYWNLANRDVYRSDDGWRVGDAPLVFFHFSGVEPDNSRTFSKHQDRFDLENSGEAALLVGQYKQKIKENSHSEYSQIPYKFAAFRSGERIPVIMRRGPVSNTRDPFERPNIEYWNALDSAVDPTDDVKITRFMMALHKSRNDLREAFPLTTSVGRLGFLSWFSRHGAAEAGAWDALINPTTRSARTIAQRLWLALGRAARLL